MRLAMPSGNQEPRR
ncbi:YmiA family putative membrane protein, partial [Escherichia coli]